MSAKLYTREVLELATGLSRWPLDPALALTGEARSRTCGSVVTVGLELDGGAIARVGLKVQACAIGQSAAALFAEAATGKTSAGLTDALAGLELWLGEGGPLPDWPGLAVIAAARDYPARHGAILLPWQAALAALPSDPQPG